MLHAQRNPTAGAERETGEGRVPGEVPGLHLSPHCLMDERFRDTACSRPCARGWGIPAVETNKKAANQAVDGPGLGEQVGTARGTKATSSVRRIPLR